MFQRSVVPFDYDSTTISSLPSCPLCGLTLLLKPDDDPEKRIHEHISGGCQQSDTIEGLSIQCMVRTISRNRSVLPSVPNRTVSFGLNSQFLNNNIPMSHPTATRVLSNGYGSAFEPIDLERNVSLSNFFPFDNTHLLPRGNVPLTGQTSTSSNSLPDLSTSLHPTEPLQPIRVTSGSAFSAPSGTRVSSVNSEMLATLASASVNASLFQNPNSSTLPIINLANAAAISADQNTHNKNNLNDIHNNPSHPFHVLTNAAFRLQATSPALTSNPLPALPLSSNTSHKFASSKEMDALPWSSLQPLNAKDFAEGASSQNSKDSSAKSSSKHPREEKSHEPSKRSKHDKHDKHDKKSDGAKEKKSASALQLEVPPASTSSSSTSLSSPTSTSAKPVDLAPFKLNLAAPNSRLFQANIQQALMYLDQPEEDSIYSNEIKVMNDGLRQLLCYVPADSKASAQQRFIEELIKLYKYQYIQFSSITSPDQRTYLIAFTAYFIRFYDLEFSKKQSGDDKSHSNFLQSTKDSASTPARPKSPKPPSSSPSHGVNISADSDASSVNGTPSGLVIRTSASAMQTAFSHSLFAPVLSLLSTIASAFMMNPLEIAIWSIYLDRFEPFWRQRPIGLQVQTLLFTAYALKLTFTEDHSIFLPYLTGLYPSFSELFSDFIHQKSSVKLGISPIVLNQRFLLFSTCRVHDSV